MWQWIKVSKGIALLAFVLPWMTVSCSGTEIASATGVGLTFGHFSSNVPGAAGSGAPMNFWLVLALAVIAFGLFTALTKSAKSARTVLITSGVAFVMIFVGTLRYGKAAMMQEAAQRQGQNGFDQAAAMMIQVQWHFGYWLELLALLAAAGLAWQAMREGDLAANGASVGSGPQGDDSPAPPPAVPDEQPTILSRTCPECGTRYGSEAVYCSADGAALG